MIMDLLDLMIEIERYMNRQGLKGDEITVDELIENMSTTLNGLED
jgi:hypothetical protein